MKKIILKTVLIFLLLSGLVVFSHAEDLKLSAETTQALQQYVNFYAENGGSSPSGGFNLWNLVGNIIFSSIGFIAFMYGKKNSLFKPMMIGVGLMAYSYFLSSTILVYVVGVVLCACLYFFRE